MAGDDDIVGYELQDGRLICEDCATAYEEDELAVPICYYQPRAEDTCDDCGLRLDGEPVSEDGDDVADVPHYEHDHALCGFRRDR